MSWPRAWVVALGLAANAQAQDTPSPFETTVRGARRVAPGQVELSREALDDQGAQSAADALQWDPAMTAPAGARGEHIFTLRGFDQRQTAVLLDGAPFELPYDGQLDLAMVPAALIERIELLKSPGSVSVGPNGLGGAVNIVTRRAGTGPLARAWGEVSHLWGRELRFEHSLTLGRVAWTVSGGHLEQPAWPLSATFAPTDYERGPLRGNSDKTLDHVALSGAVRLTARHSVSVTAWLFDGARGMPPSTLDDRPRYWRFTAWRAFNAQAAHRYEGETFGVDTLAWVRNFDNLLDAYDNDRYRSQSTPRAFSSWYHDPVVGLRSRGRLRVEAPWGPVHARLWLGGQWQAHTSTTTQGDATERYERVTGTLIPEVETSPTRWLTVQAALQADVELPLALPGVQAGSGLGPRLTAQARPASGLVLTVSGARTTRFPGLKERFSSAMGFREPNPALGPEAAWTATAEARWAAREGLELMLLASHSAVDGLITTVTLPGGLSQLQNVDHAQLSSVEGKVAWRPVPALRLELGALALRAVQLGAAGEVPLDYRAPVQGVAEVRWSVVAQLFVWAGLKASAPRPFLNPDTRRQDTLPAFADLSVRVEGRPAPGVAAWVRASNVLDAAVDGQYGFPRPGRQVFFGLSLDVASPGGEL